MVKLIAVGDIFLKTRDNSYPFKNVQILFKNKDILFGNLETVLSNNGEKKEKAVILNTSPNKVTYLREMDFDILNVANNHILDLGAEGFHKTLEVLNENNLTFIGVNNKPERRYVILERQGIKIGFLGYTGSVSNIPERGVYINKIEIADIKEDIKSIKSRCDFVTISLHWGIENVFYPSPKQIDLARSLIDAGATVILGHHPHVIQAVEQYKHGLIAYSLGNFQFNPKLSYSKTNYSIILHLEFSKKQLENYYITPIMIDQNFIPTPVFNKDKKEILNLMNNISKPITDNFLTWNRWFEEIAGEYLSGNVKSWIIRIKKYGAKHLLQCIRWLISPFVVRCYLGFLTRKLKGK